MIKDLMSAPCQSIYIRPNGLRDYQVIDVRLNVSRYLKVSVLIRDDDDYPFMYYPVFDTISKIMKCDGMPELLCKDMMINEFSGIYGIPIQYRT